MRRLEITAYGSIDQVVHEAEVPTPAIGAGDVLIRVLAASINPIDYKFAHGALRRIIPLNFPAAFGFDACGRIDAVGADVHGFVVGELVYARAPRERMGAFADYLAIDARLIARPPAGFDANEAASIPLVALTTLQALVERARARPGQRVLIHAGSGGLGSFAIQYAKRVLGLHVSTTTSSRNAEWVEGLGADRVYRYDREDYRVDRDQFDIVFDTLGGAATRAAFTVLKPGGCVVSVAGPPDRDFAASVGANPLLAAMMWLIARPVYLRAWHKRARYYRFLTESSGAQLQRLQGEIDATQIRPIIDRIFPFYDAIAALQYAAAGRARGKIVLTMAPPAE